MNSIDDLTVVTADDAKECRNKLQDCVTNLVNAQDVNAFRLALIKLDGTLIRFVESPTYEEKLAAVQRSGCALQYISQQTQELCEAAVKQNGLALEYVDVDNVTDYFAICQSAVEHDGMALQYAKVTSDLERIKSGDSEGGLFYCSEDMLEVLFLKAIKRSPEVIKYIKHLTMEMQWNAVMRDGMMLEFCTNVTPELCLAAVTNDGRAIGYVPNHHVTDELREVAKKTYDHVDWLLECGVDKAMLDKYKWNDYDFLSKIMNMLRFDHPEDEDTK